MQIDRSKIPWLVLILLPILVAALHLHWILALLLVLATLVAIWVNRVITSTKPASGPELRLETIGLSHTILVMKDGRVTAKLDAGAGRKPEQVELIEHMV